MCEKSHEYDKENMVILLNMKIVPVILFFKKGRAFMRQIVYFLLFGLGLLMIVKGSDWFINAIIWFATVFKIPHIIMGATIVSISTTLPETFVSATASFKGETDVAFGNALGSIAVNTGIIMAILLIFARPKIEDHKEFIKNGLFLIFVLLFTLIVGFIYGDINRVVGIILFGLFIVYIVSNVMSAKKKKHEGIEKKEKDNKIDISRKNVVKNIIYFMIGITLVLIGSNLLVDNGIQIAEILNIPSIVIAVIFTSIGTSLPELVTTITSIKKGALNLGVGNIIGANILNIVQVVSVSSIITNISLNHDPSILFLFLPLVIIIVTTSVLFGFFYKDGFRRWHGFVLLSLYGIFIITSLLRENTPWIGAIIFGS